MTICSTTNYSFFDLRSQEMSFLKEKEEIPAALEESGCQIDPQCRPNGISAAADAVAELDNRAYAGDIRSLMGIVAGRPKPPQAAARVGI